MKPAFARLSVITAIACAVCLLALTSVRASHVDPRMWSDEFQDMLHVDKSAYPNSNWGPYFQKASELREASARGDDTAIRTHLAEVKKMLGKGDLDEDTTADLVNFVHVWQSAVTPKSKLARSK